MRTSWLLGALISFIMGVILTITIIGAIIGIPLILLSLILLIVGFIIPQSKKEVHIHHHKK
jgi:hypothetical protein